MTDELMLKEMIVWCSETGDKLKYTVTLKDYGYEIINIEFLYKEVIK